mgnify:CR=1 FL=1|tara:strand:- start:6475 stop:9480 length:3006 start_codon:yes stop_codon:yes gene_type:complete
MLLFSTDIDGTIYDGPTSSKRFKAFWSKRREDGNCPLLAYNSGRSLENTRNLIREAGLPEPEFVIGGVGTEIYDLSRNARVVEWEETLSDHWDFEEVTQLVRAHAADIEMQPAECQNPFKCSWFWRDRSSEDIETLATILQEAGLDAQIVYSSKRDLDVLPRRANKGNALAWLAEWLGVSHEDVAVAGDSGNDASMFLIDDVFRILVANAERTLINHVDGLDVYRAEHPCVEGTIAGLEEWMNSRRKASAKRSKSTTFDNLYLVHISIHGLIRGENLELGRDADTGGQCRYVLELVKALAEHENVEQVDLFTRLISDAKVSPDYAKPVEPLGNGAFIRRIQSGPRRYIRKETLWRYMDAFIDQCLAIFRQNNRLPDIIHAHYADAGYVGSRLASLLGCPFVFTGHSLGRTKLEQLLKSGNQPNRIERRYNTSTRIEAEELSLDSASFIITSTNQEVEKQYSIYDQYVPERMRVVPPGVDVTRFAPPGSADIPDAVFSKIERFLDHPERPAVLAIARADEKKNLANLIRAFGESKTLRNQANLVLVAGNRDRIQNLNPGARKVWSELLRLIDDYDLYGCVSIPKHHEPSEIPAFYRYAALRKGIFVNPALTEPFGLTLIEAAASGLPSLATNDGGPRDILSNCKNGALIEPLDVPAMTKALEDALSDPKQWEQWSTNGIKGIQEFYTWKGHVERYLDHASNLLEEITQPHLITEKIRSSLPLKDRMIFTGLEEQRIEGDAEAIDRIREMANANLPKLGFGICSGRSLPMVRQLIEELGLPSPDVYITQLGAEIHYGKRFVTDLAWAKHLAHRWEPDSIQQVVNQVQGLKLQTEKDHQHRFKISYEIENEAAPKRRREIQKLLRENNLQAKVILSQGRWLDIVPLRSGKGQAIRYVTMRWGIPADRVLFYARRGSDYEAMSGQFLAVLGADHSLELNPSKSLPRVYVSRKPNFSGLWDGIRAYGFDDGSIRIPRSASGLQPEEAEENESVLAPDFVAHVNDGE